jgi:hypothetical protein
MNCEWESPALPVFSRLRLIENRLILLEPIVTNRQVQGTVEVFFLRSLLLFWPRICRL